MVVCVMHKEINMGDQDDGKGMSDMMFNPLTMPMAIANTAMSVWMPMITGQYWRAVFSDVSHPDHGEFAVHAQLEVPEDIEDDGERNLFA